MIFRFLSSSYTSVVTNVNKLFTPVQFSLKLSKNMSDTSISLSGTEKENNRRICAKKPRKKSSASDLDSDFDINLKFHEELKDKPEVLGFIKQLQKFIKKQEKKVRKLKKSAKKCVCKGAKSKVENSEIIKNDVGVQTSDLEEFILSQKPKTITEEIKEAAENAIAQTGFVYEATSGMYYDYKTGYYYNAELGLYYDGNTGTYLSYDATSDTYTFHSQMDVVSTKPLIEEYKRQKRKQRKEQENDENKRTKFKLTTKKKKHSVNVADNVPTISLEEGECSGSDRSSDVEIVVSSESEADCGEHASSWPPCMRVIVKESEKPDKLKLGSLFMITCDGGTIGREGDHAILIPDINVSKIHARITFDRDAGKYMISDLGSQNGTVLNGARISDAKQTSELKEVAHGSTVQIGTNKLLCHVHEGLKTCGHCEPGLVQIEQPAKLVTEVEKPASKNTMYKKELRRLRKKFGLETQGNNTDLAEGYSDRAGDRRKFVGSHDGNEKTQMASLNESIPAANKGFKMLAKMGWNEGQALGKDGSGLTEPVTLISNQGKTGLGNISGAIPAASASSLRKANVWKKAQQRFQQVQEVNLEAFKETSTDDENP